MNDSDVGYDYEWSGEFNEWMQSKSRDLQEEKSDEICQDNINTNYSENYILEYYIDK